MINGVEVKRWFKDKCGIPVRVRTVKVKNPFVQVWICSLTNPSSTAPLRYSHQFPPKLRNALLRIIYGEKWGSSTYGGNVQANSISMDEHEWESLKSACASFAVEDLQGALPTDQTSMV